MGFEQRINKAKTFELEVESFCLAKTLAVAKNGSEHTHPDFVELIRGNKDPGSKLVRFEPDGVFLQDDGVWHWEAKYAKSIEKDAYETYMAYEKLGCSVVIFVKHPSTHCVYWRKVGSIVFLNSRNVVGKYDKNRQHPIDADGWICPRLGNGVSGDGSGTPYKEINFSSLHLIPNFFEIITQPPPPPSTVEEKHPPPRPRLIKNLQDLKLQQGSLLDIIKQAEQLDVSP